MNYGIPYKGGKNTIAKWVVDLLPEAENFYDLFAGGCAVTDCALRQNKYKRYIINDIESDVTQLYLDALRGKFKNENRWISRDDFFMLKDKDGFVRYLWSFGNNGEDYIYGKNIEPLEKALHYAVFFNDFSEFHKFGFYPKELHNTEIYERKLELERQVKNNKELKEKYISWYFKQSKQHLQNMPSVPRLNSADRLHRVQSMEMLQNINIERNCCDYSCIRIDKNSVIYCDIPYKNTTEYSRAFNHEKFYEWARKQTQPIFISEYNMPDDFVCVGEIKKTCTLSATNNGLVTTEKLFTLPRFAKLARRQGELFD